MRLTNRTRCWCSTHRLQIMVAVYFLFLFCMATATETTKQRDATDFNSLSAAISEANSDAGNIYIIHVRENIEITGADQIPPVTGKVNLRGDLNGGGVGEKPTISRVAGGTGRILTVDATGGTKTLPCKVTIRNLRLAGGREVNEEASTLAGFLGGAITK